MQSKLNPMTDLTALIAERTKHYGEFLPIAEVSQNLKACVRHCIYDRDLKLQPDQIEALEMICHKMARIINGDPDYIDSWDDIAGYAKLVADRLQRDQRKALTKSNVIPLQQGDS